MIFERNIIRELIEWKQSPHRKPMILRGARQVGKTTVVKEFARQFKHSVFLNLEKESDRIIFEKYSDPGKIIDAVFIKNEIPGNEKGQTLLFIDEIQESTAAIRMLRFFYEEHPEIYIIAAGSLLEFALKKIGSFPVGRVEYRYMYPLNFQEYLHIFNKTALKELHNIPVRQEAYEVLLELFANYSIIGGMPEVVSRYNENERVSDLIVIYESIWQAYKDDVDKYVSGESGRNIIRHVIDTAGYYVDQRIKFQNFGNSNYRSREVSEAFRNLDAARLIRLIYPTTSIDTPPKPDLKKSPRIQFVDTGLLNYVLGVQPEMLGMKDLSGAYKGAIIPHLVNQELISLNFLSDKKPFFWVRDKMQSSAEVDLVFSYRNKIIPVEIKSGSHGTLKSLHQFIDQCGHPYAIRMYAGSFSVENAKTPAGTPYFLMNLPYFLGTKLHEYVDYLINNYKL